MEDKLNQYQKFLFDKMTPLQREFVTKRVANPSLSSVEIYRMCERGHAKEGNAIRQSTFRLSNHPNVSAFLNSLDMEEINAAVMTREEMALALSDIARTDITDVLNIVQEGDELMNVETGEIINAAQTYWSLKPRHEMTKGGMKAISELTATRDGLKIKMADRLTVMKQLAEVAGYNAPVKTQTEITGKDGAPLQHEVKAEISDDELKEKMKELGFGRNADQLADKADKS